MGRCEEIQIDGGGDKTRLRDGVLEIYGDGDGLGETPRSRLDLFLRNHKGVFYYLRGWDCCDNLYGGVLKWGHIHIQ
jgi:hypothetical protein